MSPPLDELYLRWLYDQVETSEDIRPSHTCWTFLKQLFQKEFVWIVPNDDNRLEDGRDLRQEFLDESDLKDVDETWMRLGCSMLELFIGLSRRLSFETDGPAHIWFWRLIENVGLYKITDDDNYSAAVIDSVLETVIWRTYQSDGSGGLFPLRYPKHDQRKVELWYQLNAYVLENE